MLENSFGLLFFLKQPKNHKNRLLYVFIRIIAFKNDQN
jgi:hypothetical protein